MMSVWSTVGSALPMLLRVTKWHPWWSLSRSNSQPSRFPYYPVCSTRANLSLSILIPWFWKWMILLKILSSISMMVYFLTRDLYPNLASWVWGSYLFPLGLSFLTWSMGTIIQSSSDFFLKDLSEKQKGGGGRRRLILHLLVHTRNAHNSQS